MFEIWKVVCRSGVNIRKNPFMDSERVGTLPYGEYIEVTEKGGYKGNWLKYKDKGWLAIKHNDHVLMEYKEMPTVRSATMTDEDKTTGYNAFDQPWLIEDSGKNGTYDSAYNYNGTITNINAIHGVPYQFLPNADTRLLSSSSGTVSGPSENSNALGRTYTSKIISKMPLLLITPGRPDFMARYSEKDRKNILSSVLSGVKDIANGSNLLSKNGRYYTFRVDHVRYFNFVNPMCRIASQYLGLGDVTLLDNVPLKKYNWGDGSPEGISQATSFLKRKLESFLNTGLPGYMGFYINSDTQISESFGNNTSESSLASTTNGISDMAKELNFLLGYGAAGLGSEKIADFMDESNDINKSVENVNSMVNKLLGGNNFLSNLAAHLTTVAKGGRLMFPEIWSDSSFSRNYDVSMKFVSPDSDKLSVYLNVLVPLFHLIALVAPQSINLNPNGYSSPFLVRAVYKGAFNVDTGIVTNMSVTKGSESGWTKEGIPTSIEVNLTIKDLYDALSITSMMDAGKYDTMNNTALMDYIANICGINIFKPEVARQIDMWYTQHVPAKASDIVYNVFGNIEQNAMQSVVNLFNRTPFYR